MTINLTPAFVFLDLESTGTDFEQDSILETGVLVVNSDWQNLGSFHALHETSREQWAQCTWAGALDMHTKNGLIADLAYAQETTHFVDIRLHNWLVTNFGAQRHSLIMAGRSIGQFDLPMIKKQMPLTASLFSHRVMDTSVVERFLALSGIINPAKTEPRHRGLSDCLDELEAARWFSLRLRRLVGIEKLTVHMV